MRLSVILEKTNMNRKKESTVESSLYTLLHDHDHFCLRGLFLIHRAGPQGKRL